MTREERRGRDFYPRSMLIVPTPLQNRGFGRLRRSQVYLSGILGPTLSTFQVRSNSGLSPNLATTRESMSARRFSIEIFENLPFTAHLLPNTLL